MIDGRRQNGPASPSGWVSEPPDLFPRSEYLLLGRSFGERLPTANSPNQLCEEAGLRGDGRKLMICAVKLINDNIFEPFPRLNCWSVKGVSMAISLNGESYTLPNDPRVSLLDFIRHDAGLSGTKKGRLCTLQTRNRKWRSCAVFGVT